MTTYSNVSDEALENATGKVWEEWFAVLDAADATKMSHKEIAQWLNDNHIESGWWCQSVTVGYEQARGIRKVNQKLDGFTVSVSKTLPLAVSPVYEAWAEAVERSKWLPDSVKLDVTTARQDKSIRGRWDGTSVIAVSFTPKGDSKTQVVVQHERLAAEGDVERMRSHWKGALAAMEKLLS